MTRQAAYAQIIEAVRYYVDQPHINGAVFKQHMRELLRDADDPPRCKVCGSYKWIYKGDRQVCADCGR
jgi:hypothetical protein